jgi:hypothetical protein
MLILEVLVVATTEMVEEAVWIVALEGVTRMDHHLEPNWCATCARKLATRFSTARRALITTSLEKIRLNNVEGQGLGYTVRGTQTRRLLITLLMS